MGGNLLQGSIPTGLLPKMVSPYNQACSISRSDGLCVLSDATSDDGACATYLEPCSNDISPALALSGSESSFSGSPALIWGIFVGVFVLFVALIVRKWKTKKVQPVESHGGKHTIVEVNASKTGF